MSGNRTKLEVEIQLLNEQYETALEKGEEFSVLREIKDRLKELKDQIAGNGYAQHWENGESQAR